MRLLGQVLARLRAQLEIAGRVDEDRGALFHRLPQRPEARRDPRERGRSEPGHRRERAGGDDVGPHRTRGVGQTMTVLRQG